MAVAQCWIRAEPASQTSARQGETNTPVSQPPHSPIYLVAVGARSKRSYGYFEVPLAKSANNMIGCTSLTDCGH